MSEKKGGLSEFMDVYYCEECKALCLTYVAKVQAKGESLRVMQKDGSIQESKWTPESEQDLSDECVDCGEEIYRKVSVPIDLYERIYDKLKEKDETNFYVEIEASDDRTVDELSPQEIYDQIFIHLV